MGEMDIKKSKDSQALTRISEQALPELQEIRARWPQGTSADIDRLLQIVDVQGNIQTQRGLLVAATELLRTIREGQAQEPGAIQPAMLELIDAFLRLGGAGPARTPPTAERFLRN
jgi:hypothetical protein